VDQPEAERVVLTRRGEEATVGTEGGRTDRLPMAAEPGDRRMRLRIQQEDGLLIRIPDSQPTAVRAIGQGPAFGREQPLPGRPVVNPQLMLLKVGPTRCGNSGTIRADGEAHDGRTRTWDFLADP